jgi:serine/threonine protein kinase
MDREVALKVVRLDRADDRRATRRIKAEAKLAGTLFHNGIPPIFDRDTLSDGRPFFTMRAIQGTTLMHETIQFHSRSGPGGEGGTERLRTLVKRLFEVTQAVDAAHACGVIHRDLKLANVVLPYVGPAQVVDWGLAVDLSMPPRRLSRAGTRGYMPPEQEHGRQTALAPTADVYAIGEMLARVLFGVGHKEARPTHPAHAPPPALARVCSIARDPNPTRRYTDARALGNALQEALVATRPAVSLRPRLAS